MSEKSIFLHNISFMPIKNACKPLLTLIAFRNKIGLCKHSNSKMGQLLGCDRSRITAQLKDLKKDGCIEIINPGNRNSRKISITETTLYFLRMNTNDLINQFVKEDSYDEESESIYNSKKPSIDMPIKQLQREWADDCIRPIKQKNDGKSDPSFIKNMLWFYDHEGLFSPQSYQFIVSIEKCWKSGSVTPSQQKSLEIQIESAKKRLERDSINLFERDKSRINNSDF